MKILYDMVKNELQVTSYDLGVMSYYLRVESLKAWAEIQKSELKSSICEFKFTSYEFNIILRITSPNPRVTSLNS